MFRVFINRLDKNLCINLISISKFWSNKVLLFCINRNISYSFKFQTWMKNFKSYNNISLNIFFIILKFHFMIYLWVVLNFIFQFMIAINFKIVPCLISYNIMWNEFNRLIWWGWIVLQSVLENLRLSVPCRHRFTHCHEHLFWYI